MNHYLYLVLSTALCFGHFVAADTNQTLSNRKNKELKALLKESFSATDYHRQFIIFPGEPHTYHVHHLNYKGPYSVDSTKEGVASAIVLGGAVLVVGGAVVGAAVAGAAGVAAGAGVLAGAEVGVVVGAGAGAAASEETKRTTSGGQEAFSNDKKLYGDFVVICCHSEHSVDIYAVGTNASLKHVHTITPKQKGLYYKFKCHPNTPYVLKM